MEIEEGVIRRGRRPRRITPSKISIILHMIRKPNSTIGLLFIQNNSQFKHMAKTCLPPSIQQCYVHLRQCTFRVVQLRKYSPNSRCRPSSCPLAVLTYVQDRSCQQKFASKLFSQFQQKRFKEDCYQKSIEEIANVAKIVKERRIFLAM